MTSPVLISLAALSTVCGFMWLPEPRSSPAPHFDGQRWLSGGGDQLGVCASAARVANSRGKAANVIAICFMTSSHVPAFAGSHSWHVPACARPAVATTANQAVSNACSSQETLRVDVDLELEVALRLGRGGEPFPQIGR